MSSNPEKTETTEVTTTFKPKRIIGIRPRIKVTKEGEAHPTELFIKIVSGAGRKYELPDEDAELDFVKGRLPITWRAYVPDEDLSGFNPDHLIKDADKKITEVPSQYIGFEPGDLIAMALGGSGDYLAFALARRGTDIGARVIRIPPFKLKEEREARKCEIADDAETLTVVAAEKPELFYAVLSRDMDLIIMRETLRQRIDAMKARIACEQRLRQRLIGEVFCNPEAGYPEGQIEKMFDARKASDIIFQTVSREEQTINKALTKSIERLEVYQKIFKPIEGVGPMIAARLISSIQDIRRFSTEWKLRKFCGVHCTVERKFPRRRNDEQSNWNPDARQALYLLADQFNRRANSLWGQKFLANKEFYKQKRPYQVLIVRRAEQPLNLAINAEREFDEYELRPGTFRKEKSTYVITRESGEIRVTGKLKYTKGHLHKQAIWRTLSEFVSWLYYEWWELERQRG